MSLPPAVRRLLLAVTALFLLLLAWTGLTGGLHDLSTARTMGQQLQAVTQGTYGVLSGLAVATLVWGRRWRAVILGAWAASLTVAAGLAAVVWGDASIGIGILSAAATLLLALAIIWVFGVGARGLTSP
jgi:hypothetical protein